MDYIITARVPQESLGTAIDGVTQHLAPGYPVSVAPAPAEDPKSKRGGYTRASAPRGPVVRPQSELATGKVVIDALKTGPCLMDDLRNAMENAGFKSSSASSVISGLIREGVATKGSDGKYRLVEEITLA